MAASPALPTPDLELTTEKNPGVTIVRGTGKINAASASVLQSTVRSAIPGSQRIVLDLTGVDYIDSTGLGALVSIYMAARNANCELELSNPKPRVSDLLKLTKLASVFEGHHGGGI
jgi:anti-sigma B factor antagonist